MRLLVAGGAGYIGTSVIPELIARGHEVDVVDLLWFGNHLPASVRVIRKDILALTEPEVAGYDCVIFLAGLSNDPMADFDPAQNFVANAAAPGYLAYLAKKARARRYIYAGSCSVYGFTNGEPFDEDAPAVSTYPYGISKLQGEKAALQLNGDGFSVIVLRQGTVSGYSPRMRLDLIINTMFRSAIANGEIVVNNPAIWRPVLAIDDAVQAYVRAVEAPESVSGVFNVASGNWTVGEAAELVRESLERTADARPRVVAHDIPDVRNYRVSVARAASELGFAPASDVRGVVEQLVLNRPRFADLDAERYYNIRVFKGLAAR